MMRKFVFTFFALAALTMTVKAQETQEGAKKSSNLLKNWSVSGHFGSMLFYGDVREYDYYPLGSGANYAANERKWGYGITVNKAINPTLLLQGQLLMGNLAGTRRAQNEYFEASTFSYTLNAQVNLSNILFRNAKPRKVSFYGTAGIGYANFRTCLRQLSTNSPSDNDKFKGSYGWKDAGKTKDDMTTEVVVPLGLGIKYKINDKFDCYLESTIHNVNTDKLDAKVVTGTASDKFGYTCIGITYRIGAIANPVEWQNPLKAEEAAKVDSSIYQKVDSLAKKLDVLDKTVKELMKKDEGPDSDGDGVIDNKDMEPDTKAGAMVNFQGRTINAAPVAPVDAPAGKDGKVPGGPTCSVPACGQAFASVNFAFGSSEVTNASTEKIAMVARTLKLDPASKIILEGHADKIGSEKANIRLSEKRANAIKKILIKNYGIQADRITTVGKGKSDPLSPKINAVNRRVDFILAK